MDHKQAVEDHAVERYFLGELSPEERDAFEEHYFTCTECAAEVCAGARFRANARRVLAQPESIPARLAWSWRFVPIAASVALLGGVVYQGAFQVPRLRRQIDALGSAHAIASFPLPETTRGISGADPVTRIPSGIPFFSVYFELPTGVNDSSYLCSILNSAGTSAAEIAVPAPPPGEPVTIWFNRAHFPPGRYKILVHGATKSGDQAPVIPAHIFELN